MNSYNVVIRNLRKEKGLSLKEASKRIGISRLSLFFYENGYFRPRYKALSKIEEFYEKEISIRGIDAYPTPTMNGPNKKHTPRSLFVKRLVFGILSLVMLGSAIGGGFLFDRSVNNAESYYGDTYNILRNTVHIRGASGHDIVTAMEYYQVGKDLKGEQANVIFYKTDNLLYFNECNYSTTTTDLNSDIGIGRYHFLFGGSLGVNSYVCTFTYGSITQGTSFSCNFIYNKEAITEISNFKILVQGHLAVDEKLALTLINNQVDDVNLLLSTLMSEQIGQQVDFYADFLPAREMGRIMNYRLQIVGLSMLLIGIIFFFLFGWLFTRLMIVNIKPRLVNKTPSNEYVKRVPLPEDIHMKVGIPDYFIYFFALFLVYLSFFMMGLGLLGRLGIFTLPSFFHSEEYLFILKVSLLAGVFLEHFVVLGRHKTPDALLKKIIYYLFLFLFVASLETAVIVITNSWGYDISSLIYRYIPGNIFQIIAVQYLIYLFLFFQPPFLNKRKKWVRYLWHSLSFIPLGFLIVSYFVSNAYALTYGVQENVFVNFWFPNGFLPLSVVSTLFMYTIFFLSLFYEKKYGPRKAQVFFYGDRYTLIENLVCVGYIIIVGLLDLLFIHNQYGYYLGLGYNYWIFTLIPFILLTKYSPNRKQTLILEEEIEEVKREIA